MSYQVFARKFRPQNFSQLVGQEHVVQALVNGLNNDRVHHAYLFTGTRGVGKTTIARIMAKALNCERGVSGSPCCECTSCKEIAQGEFMDLIEVDAASRTGVDDTRELLENVQYAPSKGRYKIYLIDEVHMFSKSSFNALLKTLEEPPPHVKFLLATTEAAKLPITVLSRCLQFNLKRLSQKEISAHIAQLLENEQLEFELPAVQLLARVADGSMRDALSLLDQALAFGDGALKLSEVRSMLGIIEQRFVLNIVQAVANADVDAVFAELEQLHQLAPDYLHFLKEMHQALHEVAMLQSFGKGIGSWGFEPAVLQQLAQDIDPETLQLHYQIVELGLNQIKRSVSRKNCFEMVVMRLLNFELPDASAQQASGNASGARTVSSSQPSQAQARGHVRSQSNAHLSVEEKPVAPVGQQQVPQKAASPITKGLDLASLSDENWPEVFAQLPLKGTARELARNINVLENDGKKLIFGLPTESQVFMTPRATQALKKALVQDTQEVRIDFVVDDSVQSVASQEDRQRRQAQNESSQAVKQHPVVDQLINTFDAEIIQPN